MAELNNVQRFYKDKSIFITGASGFMGKVLLEKLLYSCTDLKQIFILMRPKKGKSAEQRVQEFKNIPLFKRITEEKPSVFNKIVPVYGDITLTRLGLSEDHFKMLCNEVHVVYHMAATLKLEATLKPAIEMNLNGTKNFMEVCKSMKNLLVACHLSTAFCNCDQNIMEEKVYDWPHAPNDLIKCAEWMDEKTMDDLSKTLMAPHPNTYLYSKRLAEILVRDEYPNLPLCIVRPSIVTPAWEEPFEGWVDSLNGPIGVMVASAKGVNRSMLGNRDFTAEVIPVDQAIAGLITIGYTVGTMEKKPKDIPVFNVTCEKKVPATWGVVLDEGKQINYKHPFEAGLWYPDGGMTTNKYYHYLIVVLFQWLPALLIDFLLMCFGQRRFMVHVQKRIYIGLFVLQFFTMRNWKFPCPNYKEIFKNLTPEEQEMFNMDPERIDVVKYLKKVILGGRQYCLKEPLSSLPKARIQMKILYVLDRACKLGWMYLFATLLLKWTGYTGVITEFLSSLKA